MERYGDWWRKREREKERGQERDIEWRRGMEMVDYGWMRVGGREMEKRKGELERDKEECREGEWWREKERDRERWRRMEPDREGWRGRESYGEGWREWELWWRMEGLRVMEKDWGREMEKDGGSESYGEGWRERDMEKDPSLDRTHSCTCSLSVPALHCILTLLTVSGIKIDRLIYMFSCDTVWYVESWKYPARLKSMCTLNHHTPISTSSTNCCIECVCTISLHWNKDSKKHCSSCKQSS